MTPGPPREQHARDERDPAKMLNKTRPRESEGANGAGNLRKSRIGTPTSRSSGLSCSQLPYTMEVSRSGAAPEEDARSLEAIAFLRQCQQSMSPSSPTPLHVSI